ncbi:transcriptional regulator family protein [Lederbergia lenta]|uniref:Transcriptional regulator family protein n=2 Tax=Lederbergia lenta TaxID=1467 RepID=A0A2X4W633_LEDLE|nr:transcriptional regulator family protein [Lederbergia lenta]
MYTECNRLQIKVRREEDTIVKMIDVAQLANVSTATVSRVLQNPEEVKEETRKRVLSSIKQLNYQPNVLARHLRKNKTNTILVVVPNILNTVFSHIVGGIEHTASKNNFRVILGNSNKDINKEYDFLNVLKQRQVDGMILLSAQMDSDTLNELVKEYSVVIASEYKESVNAAMVTIDNIKSGIMATRHLLRLGHKQVAHISGPLSNYLSKDRFKGYKQAIIQQGLEVDSDLIKEGAFTLESGFDQTIALLNSNKPFSALFAANDVMAIGAIKAAKVYGVRVPEDLAVVGFDNIGFSSVFDPGITTIAQPMTEMGNKAMELLLKSMKGTEYRKERIMLQTNLIIRESCGAKK